MSTIRNLTKKYSDFELNIPTWELSETGVTALWGPSGSGKTTVLRVLTGLEECENWSWDFRGKDLAKLPASQRRLGVVFQSYELFPHLTARQNIEFAAKARKIPSEAADQKLSTLSQALQLQGFLNRKAEVLSGGERQRVALARALMGEPQFVLLDEPFSALDEDLRDEARKLVKSALAETKIPALLITHDRRDIDALATQVDGIRAGKIVKV